MKSWAVSTCHKEAFLAILHVGKVNRWQAPFPDPGHVALLTGIIWTVDKLVWSKQRAAKIAAARASAGSNIDEDPGQGGPMPVWIEQTGGVFRSSRWC